MLAYSVGFIIDCLINVQESIDRRIGVFEILDDSFASMVLQLETKQRTIIEEWVPLLDWHGLKSTDSKSRSRPSNRSYRVSSWHCSSAEHIFARNRSSLFSLKAHTPIHKALSILVRLISSILHWAKLRVGCRPSRLTSPLVSGLLPGSHEAYELQCIFELRATQQGVYQEYKSIEFVRIHIWCKELPHVQRAASHLAVASLIAS